MKTYLAQDGSAEFIPFQLPIIQPVHVQPFRALPPDSFAIPQISLKRLPKSRLFSEPFPPIPIRSFAPTFFTRTTLFGITQTSTVPPVPPVPRKNPRFSLLFRLTENSKMSTF